MNRIMFFLYGNELRKAPDPIGTVPQEENIVPFDPRLLSPSPEPVLSDNHICQHFSPDKTSYHWNPYASQPTASPHQN